MLYSKSCQYGIRALSYLAGQPAGELRRLDEISEAMGIPGPFASKILQDLVRAGILTSTRGPGGGYCLARPAAEVTLLELTVVIDGPGDLDRCAVGLDQCSDDMPCPLHDVYKPLRESIRDYLAGTTLEDMSAALTRKRALLESPEDGRED